MLLGEDTEGDWTENIWLDFDGEDARGLGARAGREGLEGVGRGEGGGGGGGGARLGTEEGVEFSAFHGGWGDW